MTQSHSMVPGGPVINPNAPDGIELVYHAENSLMAARHAMARYTRDYLIDIRRVQERATPHPEIVEQAKRLIPYIEGIVPRDVSEDGVVSNRATLAAARILGFAYVVSAYGWPTELGHANRTQDFWLDRFAHAQKLMDGKTIPSSEIDALISAAGALAAGTKAGE